MTETAELPFVLTPRTLDVFRPYLTPAAIDDLRESLQRFFTDHVEPLYAATALDFDSALLRAVPVAAQPRTELIVSFLRAVDPEQCVDAFREAFRLTHESLEHEGWRLGDAAEALKAALEHLASMIPGEPPPVGATAAAADAVPAEFAELHHDAREVLESVLLRAVEIDLCVFGPLAYVQGDLPHADTSRIRRGCEIAAVTASMVYARHRDFGAAELKVSERSEILHDLAGSWPDSEEDERALRRIYEDRTRGR